MVMVPNHCEIVVLWIPSHSGIKENDFADKMAKEALVMTSIAEIPCSHFTLLHLNKTKQRGRKSIVTIFVYFS